eukprot:746723-Prymnesium_polylepis.2
MACAPPWGANATSCAASATLPGRAKSKTRRGVKDIVARATIVAAPSSKCAPSPAVLMTALMCTIQIDYTCTV